MGFGAEFFQKIRLAIWDDFVVGLGVAPSALAILLVDNGIFFLTFHLRRDH